MISIYFRCRITWCLNISTLSPFKVSSKSKSFLKVHYIEVIFKYEQAWGIVCHFKMLRVIKYLKIHAENAACIYWTLSDTAFVYHAIILSYQPNTSNNITSDNQTKANTNLIWNWSKCFLIFLRKVEKGNIDIAMCVSIVRRQ